MICIADLLEELWVLILVFAPLDVTKPVPPSELVLVCWWFLVVENFHSDSVVALGVTVNFECGVELCLYTKCGKSG